MKNYTFVKNVKGSLGFTLDSWNMQLPSRDFVIAHNINQISIPEDYALGLFISSETLDMFQNGYFNIKDFKDLVSKAQEIGLFADVTFNNALTLEEIEKFVRESNEKKIREILENHREVEMDNLITVVRENIDSLPSGIITEVEEACGAELRIE